MVNQKKVEKSSLCMLGMYERTLIEASLDFFMTIDKEGRIVDVNKATEEVTGFNRKKIIGSEFSSYFVENEKAKEVYKETLLKGFVRDYSLTIIHQSGKLTHILYNASVYKNEECKIEGVLVVARDITRVKDVERILNKKIEEMAKINDLMVGRELRIIELKEKIKELEGKLKIKN